MKINKAPGPNFKSKQQKSIEPNLPLLFGLGRGALIAVCCLLTPGFVAGRGGRSRQRLSFVDCYRQRMDTCQERADHQSEMRLLPELQYSN